MQRAELEVDKVANRVVFDAAGATDASVVIETFDVALSAAVFEVKWGHGSTELQSFSTPVNVSAGDFSSGLGTVTIEQVNGAGGVRGKPVLAVEVTTAQTNAGTVFVSVQADEYCG